MAQNSDAVLLQGVAGTPPTPSTLQNPRATEKSARKIRSAVLLILGKAFCIFFLFVYFFFLCDDQVLVLVNTLYVGMNGVGTNINFG